MSTKPWMSYLGKSPSFLLILSHINIPSCDSDHPLSQFQPLPSQIIHQCPLPFNSEFSKHSHFPWSQLLLIHFLEFTMPLPITVPYPNPSISEAMIGSQNENLPFTQATSWIYTITIDLLELLMRNSSSKNGQNWAVWLTTAWSPNLNRKLSTQESSTGSLSTHEYGPQSCDEVITSF